MDLGKTVLNNFLNEAKSNEELAYILSSLGPEDLETLKDAIYEAAEEASEVS